MITTEQVIFIIDDDTSSIASLSLLLKANKLSSKSFRTASSFLKSYNENMAGCILIDLKLSDMSGIELQSNLRSLHSVLPVIFLSSHPDIPSVVKAIKAGAVDFLLKPYNEKDLLEAIGKALKVNHASRLSKQRKDSIQERLNLLTPREKQVLEHIISGQANKVIAGELSLSQRTVEIHRSNVMHKMQTHSLAQLVGMVKDATDSDN